MYRYTTSQRPMKSHKNQNTSFKTQYLFQVQIMCMYPSSRAKQNHNTMRAQNTGVGKLQSTWPTVRTGARKRNPEQSVRLVFNIESFLERVNQTVRVFAPIIKSTLHSLFIVLIYFESEPFPPNPPVCSEFIVLLNW